jgi:hypothetical protein
MTDFERFLRPLREGLADRAIEHMVVGSTAVSWLATPRVTNDVDIVVRATREQMAGLARILSARDFYFDEQSAIEAVERRSMVNAIDPASGWKVDFIVLDDEPFHREEFARRVEIETPAGSFFVQTPEDLILSKLRWGQASQSEKQFRDVVGVFDIWRPKLDVDYLKKWGDEIGVRELLDELFDRPA